jgi:hypothetical protein
VELVLNFAAAGQALPNTVAGLSLAAMTSVSGSEAMIPQRVRPRLSGVHLVPIRLGQRDVRALLVSGAGGAAGVATDVCYQNAEQAGEGSRWYLADGKKKTRSGNCSGVI